MWNEATSQIDVESEQLIHDVLEKFVQHRTVFMITHRPSTLALADRIVVMEEGEIVTIGSHAELLARGGLYAQLATLQFQQDMRQDSLQYAGG